VHGVPAFEEASDDPAADVSAGARDKHRCGRVDRGHGLILTCRRDGVEAGTDINADQKRTIIRRYSRSDYA
jgi:hypothetical protein